jgi:class 3 adenylate cyclase
MTKAAVRTANLAIVFTDIKGFTERTSRQTLEENEQLLKTHNELLAPLFKGLGGRIVKTIGDAFMVTFESPTSAVLSGLAIQDALWAYNRAAAPEKQLHVRVAINVGEVRIEGNDVFGEPVNIAARVEGLAEADEVTFTEAVYLSMNRAEVPSEELGRFELKGIPEPVRVFKATKWAAGPDAPPFGNKGLDRVGEAGRTSSGTHRALELASSALSTTTDVASRALESTSKLVQESLVTAKTKNLPWKPIAAGVGVILALLLALTLVGGDSPVERAIAEVAGAKGDERSRKADVARRLIAQEKDAPTRSYLTGRLAEALEENAVGHYVSAAKAGHPRAEGALIELLQHKKCGVRANAADALADLKVKRARGALEALAKEGGPGDGEQVLIFGCNSKQAAANALARLKD